MIPGRSVDEANSCGELKSKTRQAVYVKCNSEARSCQNCCSGEAISITYSGRVIVSVGIQHEMRMRRVVMCGLPDSITFLHIIS
jgi:hypothetical protein